MKLPTRFLVVFLAAGILLLASCTTGRVPESEQTAAIIRLAGDLCDLAPTVDKDEAYRTAEAAVRYPLELAKKNRVVSPPAYNNILINCGVHRRGLCFQWADDLTAKLMTLHLKTMELHRGVAELGKKHEHSCVVVTAIGQSFTNGIALDAWRFGGWVHWGRVPDDKYKWEEVGLLPFYKEELQAAADALEAEMANPKTKVPVKNAPSQMR